MSGTTAEGVRPLEAVCNRIDGRTKQFLRNVMVGVTTISIYMQMKGNNRK